MKKASFSRTRKLVREPAIANAGHANKIADISHILGIDYGAAKVGLALADMETKMAFQYTTLKNDRNLLNNIAEIVEKERVGRIIIGVPSYINREEVVYPGEEFGKKLQKILPEMEIEYQNEIFTTKMAQENLIEKGVKNVNEFDDQEAARIILQSFLDKTVTSNQ